ncbi:MAG: patatin-like phospholipase family protein [Bacteroidales bacterium]|nr:patatin-like phospholipase family protein [Bacteroidales bacterium]
MKTAQRTHLLLFMLLLGCTLWAQPSRPKVGVVLSGGGAKGVAHIGALRVIEEAGIPIDIICGTSMGSLIGGLYAIGYSPDILDSLVRAQDWPFLLSDRPDMQRLSWSEKRRANTYILSHEFTERNRNMPDGGMIRGNNLAALFEDLCYGYYDSTDFAQLPVAFACVATDIVDNSEVDFFGGHLIQAMRASMAIPGVFAPVRSGGRVLVDGGLRNNYPVDLAKALGADIIIGVSVQSPMLQADELTNAVTILSQIIDMNCKNKYDSNIAASDIFVRVNVDGYSSASFYPAAIDSLLVRGERATRDQWQQLIALRQAAGIDSTARPAHLHPKAKPEAQALQPLWRQPQLVRHPPTLRAGARFDTEQLGALLLTADLPLHLGAPANLSLSARLGKRLVGNAELQLQPHAFTQPSIGYTFANNNIDIYTDGHRSYNVRYRQHRLRLEPINVEYSVFNLDAGVQWDYYNFYGNLLSSTTEALHLDNAHYFSYTGHLSHYSENDWYFPTQGLQLQASYAYRSPNPFRFNHNIGISELSTQLRGNIAITPRLSLQPRLYGRLLFGDDIPLPFRNATGGEENVSNLEQQLPFPGIIRTELTNNHFVAAQLQVQYRILSSHYLQLRLGVAHQADELILLPSADESYGITAAYYYNSFFGPLGINLGYSTITRSALLYISLGNRF